jgi:FixJ family two-component response regulator
VTDVVLPRLGGRELVARLRRTRPAIKVIFMSGYTDPDLVDMSGLGPGVAFIQKPFSSSELVRLIGESLDPGSTGA